MHLCARAYKRRPFCHHHTRSGAICSLPFAHQRSCSDNTKTVSEWNPTKWKMVHLGCRSGWLFYCLLYSRHSGTLAMYLSSVPCRTRAAGVFSVCLFIVPRHRHKVPYNFSLIFCLSFFPSLQAKIRGQGWIVNLPTLKACDTMMQNKYAFELAQTLRLDGFEQLALQLLLEWEQLSTVKFWCVYFKHKLRLNNNAISISIQTCRPQVRFCSVLLECFREGRDVSN